MRTLTDEEEIELFVILNSVTESGVLGSLEGSPHGASPATLLAKKSELDSKIRFFQSSIGNLKKKVAKANSVVKTSLEAFFKKQVSHIKRADAEHKVVIRQIYESKKVVRKPAAPVSASLKSLVAHLKKLNSDYRSLDAHVKNQPKYLKKRLTLRQKVSATGKITSTKKRIKSKKTQMAGVR